MYFPRLFLALVFFSLSFFLFWIFWRCVLTPWFFEEPVSPSPLPLPLVSLFPISRALHPLFAVPGLHSIIAVCVAARGGFWQLPVAASTPNSRDQFSVGGSPEHGVVGSKTAHAYGDAWQITGRE
jgi:hypothetical protein